MQSFRQSSVSSVLFLCTLILSAGAASAQSRVPDPDNDLASTGHYYYQNLGQIVDSAGTPQSNIVYYTERTNPRIYLATDKISFVGYKSRDTSTSAADSTYRIDMKLLCGSTDESCGEVSAYEQSGDHLNYYLPQCTTGITGVSGYGGVVYKDAFPSTDMHFYSNNAGMKNYIRFRPGANPSRFKLLFTGQDSIQALGNTLKMYIGSRGVTFPDARAYQVDSSNTITPLTWLPSWSDGGGGVVTLTVGSYDPTQDLIIRIGLPFQKGTANQNEDWCTFLGDAGEEGSPVLYSDQTVIYHAMPIRGAVFPTIGQVSSSPNTDPTKKDWYITKFLSTGERKWSSYYGGAADDIPRAIIETIGANDGGTLFVAGYSSSQTLPQDHSPLGFKKSANGGGVDGVVANFDNGSGELMFSTFFGGSGDDYINCLGKNDQGQMYFAGKTTSTTTNDPSGTGGSSTAPTTAAQFPLYKGSGTRYYQYANAGNQDAFLGSFDVLTFGLTWSTFFGGSADDNINSIADYSITSNSENFYVGGVTTSPASGTALSLPQTAPPSGGYFPLVKPSSSAYYNNDAASNQGFIADFNSSHQLIWSTLFGGDYVDVVTDLATNSSGDLYAVGLTTTVSSTANNTSLAQTNHNFPLVYSGNSFHNTFSGGNYDLFITRFGATNHNLIWSTYHGGLGEDGASNENTISAHVVTDVNDNVYIGSFNQLGLQGSTLVGDIQTTPAATGRYTQAQNGSHGTTDNSTTAADGVIVQFKPDNSRVWATHFGDHAPNSTSGTADPNSTDVITGVAVTRDPSTNSVMLFFTGYTKCPNITTHNHLYQDPGNGAWFNDTYKGGMDNFIGRFVSVSGPAAVSANTVPRSVADLNVQPNPSSGVFDVTFLTDVMNTSAVQITVVNAIGQTIYEKEYMPYVGENRFQLHLNDQASGVYFLHLSGPDLSGSAKLIKY